MPNTTAMSCSVKSRVSPRAFTMSRTEAMVSPVSCGDMPAVGSSSSSRRGCEASAIASSSCFCLP